MEFIKGPGICCQEFTRPFYGPYNSYEFEGLFVNVVV